MQALAALLLLVAGSLLASGDTTASTSTQNALSESKIIGGFIDKMKPYIVQVFVTKSIRGKMSKVLCAGSSISKVHVLTAGHCLWDKSTNKVALTSNMVVVQGEYQLDPNAKGMKVTFAYVHKKHVYQQVKGVGEIQPFDVGVMRVEGILQGLVLKLPTRGKSVFAGQQLSTAGWGFTARGGPVSPSLRQGLYTVTNRQQCGHKLGATPPADQFCILESTTNALCTGDSGAPLYDANEHVVHGVFSVNSCGGRGVALVEDLSYGEVYDWVEPFTRCTGRC